MVGFFSAPVFWPSQMRQDVREFYEEVQQQMRKDKTMIAETITPHHSPDNIQFVVGKLYWHKPTGTVLLCNTTQGAAVHCVVIRSGIAVGNKCPPPGSSWRPRTWANYEPYRGALKLSNG